MDNLAIDPPSLLETKRGAEPSESEVVRNDIVVRLDVSWMQKEIVERSDAHEGTHDGSVLGHREVWRNLRPLILESRGNLCEPCIEAKGSEQALLKNAVCVSQLLIGGLLVHGSSPSSDSKTG
jgi:hypothetical protein